MPHHYRLNNARIPNRMGVGFGAKPEATDVKHMSFRSAPVAAIRLNAIESPTSTV